MAQLFRLVKYDNLPRQYIHIHMFLICCLISSHDFDGCFISYPSNTCTINHHQYGFVHVAASWSIENPEFLHDLEAGAVTEGVTVTTRGRRNNGDFMGIHWDIWCLMGIYIYIYQHPKLCGCCRTQNVFFDNLNNILNREEWTGVVFRMLWIHMVARRFSGLGWLGDTLLHLQQDLSLSNRNTLAWANSGDVKTGTYWT